MTISEPKQKPVRTSVREPLSVYFEGMFVPSRWWANITHPARTMQTIVGDGAIYPILILFALNAVDELDRTGFGILLPNIRDHFGMSDSGILSLVALTTFGALLLQVPIAIAADRGNRVRLAIMGALAWGVFSFATGLATTVWMLVLVRAGGGIGRAVNDPTHGSLLSDYYSVDRRPAVFSFHRGANAVGSFVGPLFAGYLAANWGWRAPFFVYAIPTVIIVFFALRLREPVRGAQERRAMGASEDAIATEEPVPSFAEAWRLVWKVEVLRRIWYAIPFLAVSLIGFVSLAGLLYDRVYHYSEFQRGVLASLVEPFQLVGLMIGGRIGTRLIMKDPASVFRFLRWVAFAAAFFALGFAISPNIVLTVIFNILLTSSLAILLPGLLGVLSLAIPARARAVGFSVASLWVIPGLVLVPFIGWISDHWGIRLGMVSMCPILLIGALQISAGGSVVKRDIDDVWTGSAARSQALFLRRQGRAKLLLIRNLHVFYGPVQILFDVTMDIGEGEVVALLGTNGAGKSTLLKAISGVVEADFGAVIFDGRDITHAPPNEIAAHGVTQMPGGHGTFGSLSVAENLRTACWLRRQRPRRDEVTAAIEQVLDTFPVLRDRLDEPAANLSGGQQQMLALAMSLLTQPRLLMIDELSLGLAPVVVEQLAGLVREVAAAGTTIIIVEQSVNVALTLADTAYFMEKGQIRFSGKTAELLERPDLLRSVFLAGVTSSNDAAADPADPADAGGADEPVGERPVVLATSELAVSFGGIRAVDDVSISIRDREIVGLIGPNGAGKTTLMDLISGFTAADRGSVQLVGNDVSGLSAQRRALAGLGRSFQDARLFGGLTVSETLAVALERFIAVKDPISPMLHLPAAVESEYRVQARVEELIELFGLGGYADSFISELSTGTRRVVDLACVVAHSPTVVLLDEPSSGIAQRETEALAPLIRRLRDELGCAVIVVEHDMSLLATIADRLIALESGGVIASGTPTEVLAHPRVVESYLGNTAELIARSGAVAPTTS